MNLLREKCFLQIALLLLMVVLGSAADMQSSQKEVMKQFSLTFGRHMLECQRGMNFSVAVFDDFVNYWDGVELINKEMGCAIICILFRLELLDNDGNLKNEHGAAFITASGGDKEMVHLLLEAYHKCVKSLSMSEDACQMALELADCFRTSISALNWTPSIQSEDDDDEDDVL